MKGNNVEFFGLLHLNENESSSVNLKEKNFNKKIEIYLKNAMALSNSIANIGEQLTLITNKSEKIESMLKNIKGNHSLNLKQLDFEMNVPKGLRFYSAHYKIEVFKYLSNLNNEYSIFCDLDMIAIQDKLPKPLLNCINSGIPLCYDITDNDYSYYGHEKIINTIDLVLGSSGSSGHWYGGEFLAGPPTFFKEISKVTDKLTENYINNIDNLHHLGDEAITTAAIELLKKNGVYIEDAGKNGIVGRYWNSRTRYSQPNFSYYQNCFLLHLPADKDFLAALITANNNLNQSNLFSYKKYINSPLNLYRMAKRVLLRVLGK